MPEGYDAFPRRAAERYDRHCARSDRDEEQTMAASIRSPYPDVEIPDIPVTRFVYADAASHGDRTAIVCGVSGRSYSYAMLDHLVGRCAAGFAERGLQPHEVVGIFAPNLPEYPIAFHGVAQAGATNTTINSLYTAQEAAFQLKNARARFLITIPQFLDRALPAAAEAGIEEVYVFGEADGATPFASLLASDHPVPQPEIDCAHDLVSLPYSSGTTGFPKGVMLTHRNLVANMTQFADCRDIGPDDRVIGFLPFFHIYGQTVVLNDCLRRGAQIVSMPRFDLEQFLQIIQEHQITVAYVAPPVIVALAKHPLVERFDLSSLDAIMSGAAPLDSALQNACSERLGCDVFQGYGLTETSPVTHAWRSGEVCTPGCVGKLLASTEARIVDPETATDCDRGELWIRGPQVMAGYLENAEATAATIDADGWLKTGDIVTMDEAGIFQIVDRLKELIKYKGYQVPPAELEAVLLTNPAIADAAVIGVADEEAGEIPKAFVVLKPDVVMTPAEVMDFVAAHVAPHLRVRACEFIDEIPKSASGKILRRVLVDRERAAQV
jgi:acyl-CoA synthetase (AMP-forming)/AMP-acid ligase II